MHLSAGMEALRGDWPAQRRAHGRMRQAAESWRALPEAQQLKADLARYAEGAALAGCPLLAGVTGDAAAARAILDRLVGTLCAGLRDEPFGHVPFRHQASRGVVMLQLMQAGGAALTLLAYEAQAAGNAADMVTFCDAEGAELVLAGEARLRIAELRAETPQGASIGHASRTLAVGERLLLSPARARLVESVETGFVILRLARTSASPGPSRSFRLADGALVHRASGNRGESHRELAIALLGRMRRVDAAPLLAELSGEGSEHFRWHALRECLALDVAQGFAALARIVADPADPLHAPAVALRRQLEQHYPQLRQLEEEPCLA